MAELKKFRSARSQEAEDIAVARRVLETECAGLAALARSVDSAFAEAVEIISRVHGRGRVIVTGMGKSGHVGRKIAATLASTGTPAQFVHPAEASHGDLGMITARDAVLAMSNSGETPELSDIIAYTKRHAIPLVALTARAESALAAAADVLIPLPDTDEACPLNLAPTTSTTMMVALGDALAVALLERVGFSHEDFKLRHPGGQLGKRLIKVERLMHKGDRVPLARRDIAMSEALLIMTSHSFGCIGLVDGEDRLVGVITDGDLRRNMGERLLEMSAADVMTAGPRTIPPDALADQALRVMNENSITSLFVVTDDRPVGILHIHDCLRAGVD
ncbi:MAG: KpsF/GutQ family sugar-phosphate isomerase [Defluviicoccus sp.]|nr:KpsF/GutQ family sugar-phosphate isomerase [Defluviicoccus sp.]MDE0279170.1 KpsF/GutQ family sugar-phosphate isomerase [Defluviicoccus sp.]